MGIDPRVQENAENIKKVKNAIMALAKNLEDVAWRVATNAETKTYVKISEEIKAILEA